MHMMLRKNLPLWKAEETINEVRDYCARYGVGEVIWKIDTEEFSHGLPTLSRLEKYAPWLRKSRDVLAEAGILFSVNPWVTRGHEDRGWDMRPVHPGMTFFMDYAGAQCKAVACSLSEVWREWLLAAYRLYAGTRPNVLWVEDDFREFHHPPASYGCYCPLHMRAFSERIGKEVAREEVTRAILQPGRPHPWRKEYLQMLGEIDVEVARRLEQAVHAVSPATRMGLMCSTPDDHDLEGRNWHALIRALSGPHQPVVRPTMGFYAETVPDIIATYSPREAMALTPKETRHCPELENFTYSQFNKSVRQTRIQVGLSAIFGVRDITTNWFDHVGSPMEEGRAYLEMFAEARPKVKAIEDIVAAAGEEFGIGILSGNRAVHATRLPESADFADLKPCGTGWVWALESCGIPVVYGHAPVVAATGQVLRGCTDEELNRLLSGGLLLDGSAAETLVDMGKGEMIGVREICAFHRHARNIGAEELVDPAFGGKPHRYMSLHRYYPGKARPHFYELACLPAARALSYYVNADHERLFVGCTLFDNSLGGRVAIQCENLSQGAARSYLNWTRAEMLGTLVHCLAGRNPFVQVAGVPYMLTVARHLPDGLLLLLANLPLDRAGTVSIHLGRGLRTPQRAEIVDADGAWRSLEFTATRLESGMTDIKLSLDLDGADFTALRLMGGNSSV